VEIIIRILSKNDFGTEQENDPELKELFIENMVRDVREKLGLGPGDCVFIQIFEKPQVIEFRDFEGLDNDV